MIHGVMTSAWYDKPKLISLAFWNKSQITKCYTEYRYVTRSMYMWHVIIIKNFHATSMKLDMLHKHRLPVNTKYKHQICFLFIFILCILSICSTCTLFYTEWIILFLFPNSLLNLKSHWNEIYDILLYIQYNVNTIHMQCI